MRSGHELLVVNRLTLISVSGLDLLSPSALVSLLPLLSHYSLLGLQQRAPAANT